MDHAIFQTPMEITVCLTSSYYLVQLNRSRFFHDPYGKSIRIFHDPWLLNAPDGKVVSPQNSLAPDSTVDTLIDAQTGWWNTHLIDLCFICLKLHLSSPYLYVPFLNPTSSFGLKKTLVFIP